MNLEKDGFCQKVEVPYGEADVVRNTQDVGTSRLYSCIALLLIGLDQTGLAHIPISDKFSIIDSRGPITKLRPRTFDELITNLFEKFGPTSEIREAIIAGGLEGASEDRIKQIRTILKNVSPDNTTITTVGPHDKNEEWDVTYSQGVLRLNPRKRTTLVTPLSSR
jgi:chemotaxis receptor (MCP) glutamine deamidase CheD